MSEITRLKRCQQGDPYRKLKNTVEVSVPSCFSNSFTRTVNLSNEISSNMTFWARPNSTFAFTHLCVRKRQASEKSKRRVCRRKTQKWKTFRPLPLCFPTQATSASSSFSGRTGGPRARLCAAEAVRSLRTETARFCTPQPLVVKESWVRAGCWSAERRGR